MAGNWIQAKCSSMCKWNRYGSHRRNTEIDFRPKEYVQIHVYKIQKQEKTNFVIRKLAWSKLVMASKQKDFFSF